MPANRSKKVLIVGGGASGMAAAWSLCRFPEKFQVELWDALPTTGGVASTVQVGADSIDINDQVQGGSFSYRNNLLFFQQASPNFKPHSVDFTISFGKSPTQSWSNHTDSHLAKKLQPEIAKFGNTLKWISRLEFVFAFIPISKVLKWWGFSQEFCNTMIYPLTALFFGTGNQTPSVSAAVIARVFLDPRLRLFEYSPNRLLDDVPKMFSFPKLGDIFASIAKGLTNATIRLNCPVMKLTRKSRDNSSVVATDKDEKEHAFDAVIMACGAESALDIFGDDASWLERKLLKQVRYYNDLIVTHCDEEYMTKHYTMHANDNDNANGNSTRQKDMYFVRWDEENPELIEMSFDLAAYQPHLQDIVTNNNNNNSNNNNSTSGASIYQSIYLDDNTKATWTVDQLNEDKILKKRWTRQFAHTWRHFSFWVPFLRFIQSKRNTYYAGSYTLFNTHEIAVISGLAAAERLGAVYPFADDELARMQFDLYLKIAYGFFARRRKA